MISLYWVFTGDTSVYTFTRFHELKDPKDSSCIPNTFYIHVCVHLSGYGCKSRTTHTPKYKLKFIYNYR